MNNMEFAQTAVALATPPLIASTDRSVCKSKVARYFGNVPVYALSDYGLLEANNHVSGIDNKALVDWQSIYAIICLTTARLPYDQPFASDYLAGQYPVVTVELKAVTEAMFQLGRVEDIKVITGDTVGRLKEFAELKPDWDSYGADPIQWSTIGRAIDFFTQVIDVAPLVPLPFVAPSPDGSIFFEWESCSRSIKNYIPSSPQELIEFLLVDKSSGRIDRTAGKADTLGVMVNIIREWFAK